MRLFTLYLCGIVVGLVLGWAIRDFVGFSYPQAKIYRLTVSNTCLSDSTIREIYRRGRAKHDSSIVIKDSTLGGYIIKLNGVDNIFSKESDYVDSIYRHDMNQRRINEYNSFKSCRERDNSYSVIVYKNGDTVYVDRETYKFLRLGIKK